MHGDSYCLYLCVLILEVVCRKKLAAIIFSIVYTDSSVLLPMKCQYRGLMKEECNLPRIEVSVPAVDVSVSVIVQTVVQEIIYKRYHQFALLIYS